MNVLFMYPLCKPARQIYVGYHHGIGYLSALLRQRGHRTYLYAAHEASSKEIADTLRRNSIDLVAVTSSSAEFGLAKAFIAEVLRTKPVPVFVGGPHATLAPEEVAAVEGVTGLCRGEAEEGFPTIVDSLHRGRLAMDAPGFWLRDGSDWIKNPAGAPLPLESLPFPDREIFDYAAMLEAHPRIVGAEFLAGRGCPFSCTYCSLPALRKVHAPHTVLRRRPVGHLIAEIEQVCRRYRVETVGFHDDIFTLDTEWLAAFCERYKAVIGKPFWCNTRVGCIGEQEALLLKRAGCVRVHVAVESGSQLIREKVLNRAITNEQIVATFACLKKAGLKTLAFNMIGLPFETEENIRETIALNRKIRPDRIHLTMFRPFPGTPLYGLCNEMGWIRTSAQLSYYEDQPTLEQPQLSRDTLLSYYRSFLRMVYEH